MKVFLKRMLKGPKGNIGKVITSDSISVDRENISVIGTTEFGIKLTLDTQTDQIKKII